MSPDPDPIGAPPHPDAFPAPPAIPPLLSEVAPRWVSSPTPAGPGIGSSLALTAIYVGGLILLQTVIAVIQLALGRPPSQGTGITLFSLLAAFAITVPLIPWLSRRSLRDLFQLRFPSPTVLSGAVLLTLGGWLLAGEIATLTELALPMPEFIARMFEELFSTADPVGSLVLLVVLPPIIEETLCRGLVLRAMLQRWKPSTAILVSSLVFGFIHLNPWQFFYASWLGIIFGWAYYRTRSLGLCMVMHALNNGLSWLLMRLQPEWAGFDRRTFSDPPEHVPILMLLASFGLLVAGAAILQRCPAAPSEPEPSPAPPILDPNSPPPAPG